MSLAQMFKDKPMQLIGPTVVAQRLSPNSGKFWKQIRPGHHLRIEYECGKDKAGRSPRATIVNLTTGQSFTSYLARIYADLLNVLEDDDANF